MERWIASPLWPTYMGEKVRTLGKTYERLKKGAIGNTLQGTHCKHREHNGNSMGEPIGNLKGNMLGTKENPLSSNLNLEEKKSRHFEWVLSLPIGWLREISISKAVGHHFWPVLILPL